MNEFSIGTFEIVVISLLVVAFLTIIFFLIRGLQVIKVSSPPGSTAKHEFEADRKWQKMKRLSPKTVRILIPIPMVMMCFMLGGILEDMALGVFCAIAMTILMILFKLPKGRQFVKRLIPNKDFESLADFLYEAVERKDEARFSEKNQQYKSNQIHHGNDISVSYWIKKATIMVVLLFVSGGVFLYLMYR